MKKLALFTMVVLLSCTLGAQIQTPQPSPAAKMWQTVGLTEVTVDYSRPSMRGRTIFGDLVPFNALWRTGANAYTKVSFNKDVTIANQAVEAGTYSIFTKPGKTTWEVFFYTDTQGGGTPAEWDDAKVVAKTTVPVMPIEMPVETFTITIDDVTSSGAHIGILWENTYVGIPFGVSTDAEVVKSIENVMAGPSAGDYYAAAVYYASEDKDINKAKDWMNKAMSMTEKPAFWQLRQQSLILAKSGDKAGAIATAKKSLAGAKEAGNMDYVKMNQDSLKEWGAM
ncbi:DUF2911 domain-containing protein [Croceitalea vernalis]|uniref:DUF2911 domain-containing protein n=1 Tax=Croceitalea vernalis TaxID=3075599 RepID=A0ABU3BGN8_9FLAO|nr:DUF2911 domain-containing protein [Croceitalea sp. P007]MDT0621296.1 DUF2911 domain-containing protein [Croceitalea sp. P007]